MTAKQQVIDDWAKWLFRGIVSLACGLIYFEAKEIKRDVKTLMEERLEVQGRVSRSEKDIDRLESASTNLWNRLINHETQHK
jgi:hypothetical protein